MDGLESEDVRAVVRVIIFGQLPEGAATSRRCCAAAPKIRGIISQMLRIRSMYVKRRRRLTLRAALNFACDQHGNTLRVFPQTAKRPGMSTSTPPRSFIAVNAAHTAQFQAYTLISVRWIRSS